MHMQKKTPDYDKVFKTMKMKHKNFRDEMVRLHQEGELSNIMGGAIIETKSERLIRLGKTRMIVVLGQEYGLNDEEILKQLQEKIGVS